MKKFKNNEKKTYFQNKLKKYGNDIKKTWRILKNITDKSKIQKDYFFNRLIIKEFEVTDIKIIAEKVFVDDEQTLATKNLNAKAILPDTFLSLTQL